MSCQYVCCQAGIASRHWRPWPLLYINVSLVSLCIGIIRPLQITVFKIRACKSTPADNSSPISTNHDSGSKRIQDTNHCLRAHI